MKSWKKEIALERIERLFSLAYLELKEGNEERSNRYIELARKIGMRYRLKIPKHLKMWMCKKCHSFLLPGKTARIRLRSKRRYITTTCLKCNHHMRRPYLRPRASSAPTLSR